MTAAYKGFLLAPSLNDKGQWQVHVTKADGSKVKAAGEEMPEWTSGPYMLQDNALEQVRASIDAGALQ
jgi:hypothetical protein